MTARELVVLGTASQVPTRARNHNGYLLRWDGEGILFDPGEGTQRQLTLAGVSASSITRICVTHFHGDHCLGLPGVLARIALDSPGRQVHLYVPAGGVAYAERLLLASVTRRPAEVVLHAVTAGDSADGVVDMVGDATLRAARLDHGPDTVGWQLVEPDGRRMLPDRLAAAGLVGPVVGRLARQGAVEVDGRVVRLDEVSAHRPGQRFAFVMDTRMCAGAESLAERADLLVCESTFLDVDADLAHRYQHMTARQTARLAASAGARRLVLTHFSQRYDDPAAYAREAAAEVSDFVVARDLDVVAVPPRGAARRG
jgi:ribonuclease Z